MEQVTRTIQEIFDTTPKDPHSTASFIQEFTKFTINDILEIEKQNLSLRHTHNEIFSKETFQGIKNGDSLCIHNTEELIKQILPNLLLDPKFKLYKDLLAFPDLKTIMQDDKYKTKLNTSEFIQSYIFFLNDFIQECLQYSVIPFDSIKLNPEDTLETALKKLTNNHNFRLITYPESKNPRDVKSYSNFGKIGQSNIPIEQFFASFSHTDIAQTAIDLISSKKTQTLSQTPNAVKIIETLYSLSVCNKIKEQLSN